MIRIRPEQLEMLVSARVEAFVDELIRAVADRAPEASATRQIVTAGIQAAIDRGFRTPEGIRGFVSRLFVLGTTYYEHVAVRDWIGELSLSEEERLAVVDARSGEISATIGAATGRS